MIKMPTQSYKRAHNGTVVIGVRFQNRCKVSKFSTEALIRSWPHRRQWNIYDSLFYMLNKLQTQIKRYTIQSQQMNNVISLKKTMNSKQSKPEISEA